MNVTQLQDANARDAKVLEELGVIGQQGAAGLTANVILLDMLVERVTEAMAVEDRKAFTMEYHQRLHTHLSQMLAAHQEHGTQQGPALAAVPD